MANNITIVTASGVQVELATVEVDGVHRSVHTALWAEPVEVFASSARAYSADDSVLTYSDVFALPVTSRGNTAGQIIVTDWGNAGAQTDDGSGGWTGSFSTLGIQVEVSIDGTHWGVVGGPFTGINAGDSGIVYDLPVKSPVPSIGSYPYVRIGYVAIVGDGGDTGTDEITFSILLQPGADDIPFPDNSGVI